MSKAKGLLSEREIQRLNRKFEGSEPQEVLEWALERFHPKLALSSSFGAEGQCTLDRVLAFGPPWPSSSSMVASLSDSKTSKSATSGALVRARRSKT